uniref:WD40 repeat-like protein n=1 Tax=Psilocybe cubensis TaxID=181762 RepID=A0A8H7Y286_PSICU
MGDSSASDAGAHVSYDALASLLGVKGPLRLVPQGSTPKAHVVIKRDYIREKSDSGESSTSIARFSFIAGKKFAINKGQPLLFAVAAPTDQDGKTLLCDDNTFLLEADVASVSDDNGEEDIGNILSKKEQKKEQGNVGGLPPKMRKSYSRKTSYASYIENEPPSSIGFLGYPLGAPTPRVYTSASVQTETRSPPSPSPAFGTAPLETIRSPCIPLSIIDIVEQSPVQLPSPVSADHAREPTSESLTQIEGEEMDDFSRAERSLSPMDLSSASCSPANSPLPKHDPLPDETTPNRSEREFLSFESLARDVSSGPHAQDEPIPCPPGEAIPSGSLLCNTVSPLLSPIHPPSILSPPPLPSPSPAASIITSTNPSSNISFDNLSVETIPPTTVSDKSRLENVSMHIPSVNVIFSTTRLPSEQPSSSLENGSIPPFFHKFYTTKDQIIDYRGLEVQDETKVLDEVPIDEKTVQETQNERTVHAILKESSSNVSNPVNKQSAEMKAVPQAAMSQEEVISHSKKTPPTTPNAVASSSKMTEDWSTVDRDSLTRNPGVPINLRAMRSAHSQEKAPDLLPTPLSSRVSALPIQPRNSSPPPDPKSLAYIPSGSSTNPLGIRPSSGRILPITSQKSVPKGPRSLVGPAPPTQQPKKPVVVGAKWSAARSSGSSSNALHGNVSTATNSSTIPATSTTSSHTTPTSSSVKIGLSHIMRYASPSPPPPQPDHPPPTPPVPPQTGLVKWKRISCVDEKQANVPSSIPLDPESSSQVTQISNETFPSLPSSSSLKRSRDVFTEDNSQLPENSKGPTPKKARSTSPLPLPLPQSQPTPTSNDNTSLFKVPPVLSSPIKTANTPPKVPQPMTHPLPPKPVATASSYRPPSGKRERSLEPAESKRPPPRTDWPATLSSASYQMQSSRSGVNVGIQRIVFSSDGTQIAVVCADRTLRIWENKQPAAEVARLSHNTAVVCVCWMHADSGVLTLTADGMIMKWTRNGKEWKFTKLFLVSEVAMLDIPVCMAYAKDRIAVTTPSGVKVWILNNGSWQSQRDIVRSGVTAIRFVFNGDALIGGCRDGVLWYSEVPNGTLRAHVFFPSKKPITSIDLPPTGTYLLVAQEGGQCHLVTLKPSESKGVIERTYTSEKLQSLKQKSFPAVFATRGQAVLYGTVNGCALVWDRKKGVIVYGLKHPEGDLIQAAATFDGRPGVEGLMVTGTTQGRLFWWPQPVAAAPSSTHNGTGTQDTSQRKRAQ